jgi:nitrogen fixation-related uncharacterized protein
MSFYYILMLASFIFLGGSAVYALYWAVSQGEFTKMEQGAEVIFDQGEPVGEVTDLFPGVNLKEQEEKRLAKKQRRMRNVEYV